MKDKEKTILPDHITVLKSKLVELNMVKMGFNKNIIKNIRFIKRLKKEITDIIEDIFLIHPIYYDYNFFVNLYEIVSSIIDLEDLSDSDMNVYTTKMYDCKSITVRRKYFCVDVDYFVGEIVKVKMEYLDRFHQIKVDKVQFCHDIHIGLKKSELDIMLEIFYHVFYQYLEFTIPSTLQLIRLSIGGNKNELSN